MEVLSLCERVGTGAGESPDPSYSQSEFSWDLDLSPILFWLEAGCPSGPCGSAYNSTREGPG